MLPPTVRVYVSVEPVDLRKGFDGLACVVRQVIAENPLSGHLFVFFNRRADVTKILFWTRNGYTIVHKRLEKGRFSLPEVAASGARRVEMDAAHLALLLEGIELRGARLRPRWEPPPETSRSNWL
jgi:transposase